MCVAQCRTPVVAPEQCATCIIIQGQVHHSEKINLPYSEDKWWGINNHVEQYEDGCTFGPVLIVVFHRKTHVKLRMLIKSRLQ